MRVIAQKGSAWKPRLEKELKYNLREEGQAVELAAVDRVTLITAEESPKFIITNDGNCVLSVRAAGGTRLVATPDLHDPREVVLTIRWDANVAMGNRPEDEAGIPEGAIAASLTRGFFAPDGIYETAIKDMEEEVREMKLTLQEQINEAERLINVFVETYVEEPKTPFDEGALGDLCAARDLLIRSGFIVGRMTRNLAGETD